MTYSSVLAGLNGVSHGFTGRAGGVSTGVHVGLNVGLGADDDHEAVLQNRALARDAIAPAAQLLTLHQIHSADVVTVNQGWGDKQRPKADGLVTDRPGFLLGVLGADCAPVLFADAQAQIIGACHAGWKGALAGVTDATIAAMEGLGADRSRIIAAIGPTIAQKSYEVDEGFYARFCDAAPENERFFMVGRAGHHQFDLEGYIAARLAIAGLTHIDCLGEDTYCQPERFYSYRRAIHNGEPDYGRQMGAIALG